MHDNFYEIPEEISRFPGTVMLAYRGSVAHGTYIPPGTPFSTDDIDLIAVYIADIEHYLGFKKAKTIERKIGQWDFVAYELRHFVSLLCKNNPNVLNTLYLNKEHYIKKDWQFDSILASRGLFSSKRLYHSINGYANAQIKRMLNSEQAFEGDRRRKLYEKYGYDLKQAAHALRLLNMGAEFLKTGYMRVDRIPFDAENLIAIKQGEWCLSYVQYHLNCAMHNLQKARDESKLPAEPDMDAIEKLLIKILVKSLGKIGLYLYLDYCDVEKLYKETMLQPDGGMESF